MATTPLAPPSTFLITPLLPSDFPTLHTFNASNGGDLTPASALDHWPTGDPPTRYAWALSRQLSMLADPAVRAVKATDAATGTIAATALWHVYPDGAPPAPSSGPDNAAADTQTYPPGFPARLWRASIAALYAARQAWMPAGQRAWALTQLQTRPGWRRRGAARELVRWGLAAAARDGAAGVYVEAGEGVVGFYEALGFARAGGEHRVRRADWEEGMQGEVVYVRMLARPGAAPA